MLLRLTIVEKLVADPEGDHWEELSQYLEKLSHKECNGRQQADKDIAANYVLEAVWRHVKNKAKRNSPLTEEGVNTVIRKSFSRYFAREHVKHYSLKVSVKGVGGGDGDDEKITTSLEDMSKARVLCAGAASRGTYCTSEKAKGCTTGPYLYDSTYEKEKNKPCGAQLLAWLDACQTDGQRHFLRLVMQQNEPMGEACKISGISKTEAIWLATHVLGRSEVTHYQDYKARSDARKAEKDKLKQQLKERKKKQNGN